MKKLTLLVAISLVLGLNVLDCGIKETSSTLLDIACNLVSRVTYFLPACPGGDECDEGRPVVTKPKDCAEILQSGQKSSGVYTIWPINRLSKNKSLEVYCDMDTDGGGWTVIQRRGNFSTPKDYFNQNWEQYKSGFGNLTEEFWLGNENISVLSNQADSTIRFDLRDAEGNVGYAKYSTFWLENQDVSYTLRIQGYVGNVGDAMNGFSNFMFITNDREMWRSCRNKRKGAWWFKDCPSSSLNGLNQPGVVSMDGIQWETWRGNVSLAGVEMKLKPN